MVVDPKDFKDLSLMSIMRVALEVWPQAWVASRGVYNKDYGRPYYLVGRRSQKSDVSAI